MEKLKVALVAFTGLKNEGFGWSSNNIKTALEANPRIDLEVIEIHWPPVGNILNPSIREKYFDLVIVHSWVTDPSYIRRLIPANRGKLIYAFLWEANIIPEYFMPLFKMFDVLGCTEMGRLGISNADVKFNYRFFHEPKKGPALPRLRRNDEVIFYSICSPVPRKNILQSVRCFNKAFQGEKVRYLLKLNSSPAYPDRRLAEKAKSIAGPNVSVSVDNFTDEQIEALHRTGDVYFQIQHSEGWGVPHAEAVAHGRWVVSNDCGGPAGFLNDKNSFLVPYRMGPVSESEGLELANTYNIYPDNSTWAQMEDDDVIECLRKAREKVVNGEKPEPCEAISRKSVIESWARIIEDLR